MTGSTSNGAIAPGDCRTVWLHAETLIHVGSGAGTELIDLPFARESATDYPYIPGSGMKGAFRDVARRIHGFPSPDGAGVARPESDQDKIQKYFGTTDCEGAILVSDARLAFLPLRSLHCAFLHVTCPHLLKRMARDVAFAERVPVSTYEKDLLDVVLEAEPTGADGNAVFLPGATGDKVFLEEFGFRPLEPAAHAAAETSITAFLEKLPVWDTVRGGLAVIPDAWFGYFARHGLHVRMRNALDAATKTVVPGALWSEESLPPETLLYVVLVARPAVNPPRLGSFLDELAGSEIQGYLQVGGNETVGEGWFSIRGLPSAMQGQAGGSARPPGQVETAGKEAGHAD